MSWRYWSKAVDGDERKKPLDLLSAVVCIDAPRKAELSGKRSNSSLINQPEGYLIRAYCQVNSHVSCQPAATGFSGFVRERTFAFGSGRPRSGAGRGIL